MADLSLSPPLQSAVRMPSSPKGKMLSQMDVGTKPLILLLCNSIDSAIRNAPSSIGSVPSRLLLSVNEHELHIYKVMKERDGNTCMRDMKVDACTSPFIQMHLKSLSQIN